MKILVTGGAGYIGGFMTERLVADGHSVVVVDSLERGHKESLVEGITFVQGNLLDGDFVKELFSKNKFEVVMHFAAYISVNESMMEPGLYFRNNVFTTIQLLDAMRAHDVKNFIFSSTGTVYGTPKTQPIPETHTKSPENPYAESKLMVENILKWYQQAYGIGFAVLRYFNASGAALDGSRGETHDPETHLIPCAINAALENKEFVLYGDDYPTPDGTCVRDYIHVLDLVEAHMLTLAKLKKENGAYTYNVGTGKGSSNKDILAAVKKISNSNFPIIIKERREGDVAETVADVAKIQAELGFVAKYSDLETIISSAWKWHTKSNI